VPASEQLFVELWVSLASLLRSYSAAHGLNKNTQATVELGEERIILRHGDSWLHLERDGSLIHWTRNNGAAGTLQLTEAGQLKANDRNNEEEMDLVAEAWARELMG
jgi:hypothetical protein